jgi:hypothetical protein
MVERLSDDLLDLSLQLPVVLDPPLTLPGDLLTDGFRCRLAVDPAGPTVVGPVQVLGILATAAGRLATLRSCGGDGSRKDWAWRGNGDLWT